MQDRDSSNLVEAVNRTTDVLSGRVPTTATVRMPREEFLRIDLVPLSIVKRIEELQSDSSIAQGFFWALLGALLGVLTSIILNGTALSAVDKAVWVTIFGLSAGVVTFLTLWQRATRRSQEAKKALYDELGRP